MENKRLFLFVALSVVILLLWQAWQADYAPTQSPIASSDAPALPSSSPSATDVPAVAPTPASADVPVGETPVDTPVMKRDADVARGERVRVVTDVLSVEIDTLGGDVRQADLLAYPVLVNVPDKPFRLLSDETGPLFIIQSGLVSAGAAPDHHARYQAAQAEYRLSAGMETLEVPLTWTNDEGLTVTKTYVFRPGSYAIELRHDVNNAGTTEWQGRQYRQLHRERSERESAFIYTYTGGVISSENNKYEKVDFDDMADANLSRDFQGGWVAMIQHYFVAAVVPAQDENNHYYSKALDGDRYVLGLVSPTKSIAPGESGSFGSRIYVGPKLQHNLEEVAPNLELTVDYGMLTFISKPLFWLLEWIVSLVHNWGVAIILLTLLIKLAFYKLSEASYRSMANMRRMSPKLQQLKERYGDDRQRMSKAMMELYKKEKINPLGGCLPILVQIPVFLALYWVLLESVELRQAPFVLWINDLSTKDPYYILPLIMGATMFIQQKLNPPPPDPMQAKIMMALPFIFTLFFAFFPAGLVLYWVSNNVLSITQQWYITRKVEQAAESAKASK